MFLDLDVKVLPGERTTCGVLHCKEEGLEPRISSITEMIVFKSSPRAGGRSRRTVAALSERNPNVSTLWDGIKVDGTWSKQRAQLTLYLVEQDDCRSAEFSCQVRIEDGLKEERVGFVQLGKAYVDPNQSVSHAGEACSSPSLMQLNALLQHSSSTSLQNRLEDKISSLENRLEDKITALESFMTRHAQRFANLDPQERIDQTFTALSTLEERFLRVVEKAEAKAHIPPEGEATLVQRLSCQR